MVSHESDHPADGHRIVHHQPSAIEKHRRGGCRKDGSRQSAGHERRDLRVQHCAHERIVALFEARRLVFVGAQGDDYAHAQNGVHNQTAQICAALTQRLGQSGEPALKPQKRVKARREENDTHEEQTPVQPQHRKDAANQEDDVR